jgi:hypothetical protein
MPVERSAQRIDRRLSRRDKGFLAGLACAGAIGAGVGAYAYAGHSPGPASMRCVSVTLPSTVGGASLRYCGTGAVHLCRVEGPRVLQIAAACRRAGFAVPPTG